MHSRLLYTGLAVLVSGAALWWLLADADPRSLLDLVRQAQVWQLGLALLLLPLVQTLRACRFALMLSGQAAMPSWRLFDLTVRVLVFNFLLPFKLGELSFPLLMRRVFGTEYSRSAGVLLLARLMDVGMVSGILFLSAALALPAAAVSGWPAPLLLLAGLGCILAPAVAITMAGPIRRAGARWERARPIVERLLWGAAMVSAPGQRAFAVALTAALWSLHVLIAWLVASAIASSIPLLPVAMASAAGHLAFALPVPAIAGLGPPQAAWSMALHQAGFAWEIAVAGALLTHAVILSGVMALGLGTYLVRIWWPRLAADAGTSQYLAR